MSSTRPFYLSILIVCASLLAYGYFLQFHEGLAPCPLCIFQRFAYVACGAVSLLGLLHGPQALGRRVYSGLIALASAIGAGIAAWQVRLQHLPPERVPECGPGLSYMLDTFPLAKALKLAFSGSGECAEVDWTFLKLSIAEWSLLCFVCLAIAGSVHCLRKETRR